MELDKKNKFREFIKIREPFEDILIEYDFAVQQILRHYRGSTKALPHIKAFYLSLMEELLNNSNPKELALKNVIQKDAFKFIKINDTELSEVTNSDFSDETKSSVFITEALEKALRCKICNARIHTNAISFDHKQRKQDGGLGDPNNAQLTHPYCNSAIKN